MAWKAILEVLSHPEAENGHLHRPQAAADSLLTVQPSHGNVQVGCWHSNMLRVYYCQ